MAATGTAFLPCPSVSNAELELGGDIFGRRLSRSRRMHSIRLLPVRPFDLWRGRSLLETFALTIPPPVVPFVRRAAAAGCPLPAAAVIGATD